MIGSLTKATFVAVLILTLLSSARSLRSARRSFQAPRAEEPPPVSLSIDKDKSVTVTVPHMARKDLEALMTKFFFDGRPNGPEAAEQFRRAILQSPELTFTITTKVNP